MVNLLLAQPTMINGSDNNRNFLNIRRDASLNWAVK